MVTLQKTAESYNLTREVSLDNYGESNNTSNDDEDTGDRPLLEQERLLPTRRMNEIQRKLGRLSWGKIRRRALRRTRRAKKGQTSVAIWLRRLLRLIYFFLAFLLFLVIIVGALFPNYTRRPPHYTALRQRVQEGWKSGSANVDQEKVFIAASLYDPGGRLSGGNWARNVLRLVHILGPDNVYLSIYENDSGPQALDALSKLETIVPCNHTLMSEAHLDLESLPHVTLSDGSQRTKRIAYLAEVRNRALRPLEHAQLRFDRLLYLNDVVFDPIEAAQLLFSTNIDDHGKSQYRSACAADFINPFKYYDTFASRDQEGYSMGVPFFPWFSADGGRGTLDDILGEKDAVRVRSCWGGMVAFNATFFQNWNGEGINVPTAASEAPTNTTVPYRFRAEKETWWDASECCLIQADIQAPNISDNGDYGIFVNPFVRVAYDTRTLSWLWLTRRFEKLYTPVHIIADILVRLPDHNRRRHERPWEQVEELTWLSDESTPGNGTWQKVVRIAKHDGFCGRRRLQVIKENLTDGDKNWEFLETPLILR